MEHITDSLCGAEVVFDEAWYVEEYDALALALRGECSRRRAWRKPVPDPVRAGSYKERALPMRCGQGVQGGRLLDQGGGAV